MSNETATRTTSNIFPVWGLGTVVLLVLKLTGTISISWWVVFLPLMIGTGLSIAVLLIIALVFGGALGVAHLVDKHDRKKRGIIRG